MFMSDFKALGLTGNTLKGVKEAGYTTPSPIQAATIPIAVAGDDLIGCAQTGTGKTAAFVLPMLHRLFEMPRPKRGRPVRALVVVPTRELALQVEKATRKYGKFTPFQSLAVFGGTSIDRQIRTLQRGVDIVVATPGRLLDLMNRRAIRLSNVGVLVLDEADRMFDMGFIKDIRTIAAAVPEQRQTLLFSATMPKAIQELAASIQTNPEYIQVGQRRNPAKTVDQSVCRVLPNEKIGLLCHVLENEPVESMIVFSRTKYRADRIAQKLSKKGFKAAVMHSNRSQKQREKALDGFRSGRFQILVATDVAARGIDVDSISHVINYDTPNQADSYIHRIGRTGRAETEGTAITFVTRDEEKHLVAIENHISRQLPRKVFDGFESEAPPEILPAPGSVQPKKPKRKKSKARNRNRSRKPNRQRSA
ncbi:MAG: hypothetical protein RhofKO_21690 [Rhodothermales bacterium]